MARKISHISDKISSYLASHYSNKKLGKIGFVHNQPKLNASMQVAFLRGQAFFYQSFFKALEQKRILDLDSQYQIFNSLVNDTKHITDLVNHSKLLNYFDTKDMADNQQESAFIGYCIVLFDALNRQDIQTQQAMTSGFINHYYPMLYPEKHVKKDVGFYRKELTAVIRKKWQLAVTLKESFNTSTASADFAIYAHVKERCPTLLIEKTGKRLKPTKLKAYQEMLKNLENDFYELPLPKQQQAKKSEKIKPLSS